MAIRVLRLKGYKGFKTSVICSFSFNFKLNKCAHYEAAFVGHSSMANKNFKLLLNIWRKKQNSGS